MVGYSFSGIVSLLVCATHPALVEDLLVLGLALLERESITELRNVRAECAAAPVSLLSGGDPTVGITRFLDLVAPNQSTHPRVEWTTIQRLMSHPKGLAYSLIAVNEAAPNLDGQVLIDAAPRVLSLIGSKSADPLHALHQMFSDSRDD